MAADGYHVEELSVAGERLIGFYGINEVAARDSAAWYSRLMRRAGKCYRVVLLYGGSRVVVYG